MKKIETLIIGAGISGLACAKKLYDEGHKNFIVLSKDIGGRMATSKMGTVDYGASYVTSYYKNSLNYIEKGDPLKLKDLYFIYKKGFITPFSWPVFLRSPRFIKICYLLYDFTKRIDKLRKRSFLMEQKEAIEEDPVLKSYLSIPAIKFVKENKLDFFHETFFEPAFNSTLFTDVKRSNVFYYLAVLMPLILSTYTADFQKTTKKLSKGFKKKIKLSTVKSLSKKNDNFLIKSSYCDYEAQNVVIAAPYKDARKFYKVPYSGPTIPAYVFHIVGEREEIYRNKKVVFFKQKQQDITILWQQATGSDVVFSHISNPDFNQYYDYYKIIKKTFWETALMLSGNKWVSQNLDKNLYLASDYNICGLEDSFITGVYAANQILKK
jgi:hypothetical protein